MRSHLLIAAYLLMTTAWAQELVVFAAASLSEVFEDVAIAFEAENPGVNVELNFSGSATLSTQIIQGAPADVFASADTVQMRRLSDENLLFDSARLFTVNRLAAITPKDSPLTELEDLSHPGVILVLAGPEVPAGRYARSVLEKLNEVYGADFATKVFANVVSEEPNVRQVAAKVELGEADAALVYLTDAAALQQVRLIEVPAAYNIVAEYPIAVMRESRQLELAQVFVDFVLSTAGQDILQRYGFGP